MTVMKFFGYDSSNLSGKLHQSVYALIGQAYSRTVTPHKVLTNYRNKNNYFTMKKPEKHLQ